MLVSLNWLKDFVDIPKAFSPEELTEKLTISTVEVEGFIQQAKLLDKVVVAKILDVKPHPDADRLRLVTVSDGRQKYNVVCGGSNLAPEMLVALAKVGAVVKWHGQELAEIKPAKIRGVESNGMICASEELGISHLVPCAEGEICDLSGLSVKVGESLAKALNCDDVIIEIDNKSMTHRPDLWGVYGLARELAAILNLPLKPYKVETIKAGRGKKLAVEIKDTDKCRAYEAVVIDGLTVAPSPDWLRVRLESAGLRSINNIVDVTNYVMLELGQPLHAFDYGDIAGSTIVVDSAKKGQNFITLDGQKRDLDETMLLIKDVNRGLAIAGVMGGQNSEVKNDTKTIVLEAANFLGSNIRQTSTKLGLRSESSARFEKNLSPVMTQLALAKAVMLLQQICPTAKVSSPVVSKKYFDLKKPIIIDVDLSWLNSRLGLELSAKEVVEILQRLGFVVKIKKTILSVSVPFWRATGDIKIAEDIVEEVARIYGYNRIPLQLPSAQLQTPVKNLGHDLERQIKKVLALSAGSSEIFSYTFVNPVKVAKLGLAVKDHLALENSLSADHTLLRSTLLTGLLEALQVNSRFVEKVNLFEIGVVFQMLAGDLSRGLSSDAKLPRQDKNAAGLYWQVNDDQPYFQVKGLVQNLFEQLNLDYYFEPTVKNLPTYADKKRTAAIVVGGLAVGWVGEINGHVVKQHDLAGRVGFWQFNLSELLTNYQPKTTYQAFTKFPTLKRDLAIIVDQAVPWATISDLIWQLGGELLVDVDLFDVYENATIGSDKKSLACHLIWQATDRTLTVNDVEPVVSKIVENLSTKFGAQLRS